MHAGMSDTEVYILLIVVLIVILIVCVVLQTVQTYVKQELKTK